MTTVKQNIIVGCTPEFKHLYLVAADGGTAYWSENKSDAYLYADRDDALRDWFGIDKRTFARVFICNA